MVLPGIFIATFCICALTAATIILRALIALRPATRRGLAPRLR